MKNKACPDCGTMILNSSARCRSCATRKQFLGKKKTDTQNMKGPKSIEHRLAISVGLKGKKKTKEHLANLRKSLINVGQWKKIGDTFIHKGYRCIKVREGYGNSNFILEHRYIMEKHLNRTLKPTEHIHHKNGERLDNRIENLQILTVSTHGRILKHTEKTKKRISDAKKVYWYKRHHATVS